jgi:hypothetical protein
MFPFSSETTNIFITNNTLCSVTKAVTIKEANKSLLTKLNEYVTRMQYESNSTFCYNYADILPLSKHYTVKPLISTARVQRCDQLMLRTGHIQYNWYNGKAEHFARH